MVTDFISLSSKITEDDDCSHEIKRRLLIPSLLCLLRSQMGTLPLAPLGCFFLISHRFIMISNINALCFDFSFLFSQAATDYKALRAIDQENTFEVEEGFSSNNLSLKVQILKLIGIYTFLN